MKKQSSLTRSLFSVTIVLLLVKVLGFVKQVVTASLFGATVDTDIINLAYGFVSNSLAVIAQSLLTSVVAIYINARRQGEQAAKQFAGDTFRAATLIGIVASGLLFALAPFVSRILAPSYSEALLRQLTFYVRLFAPSLILLIWISVFQSLLNANKRFFASQLEGAYQSLAIVFVSALFAPRLGVDALAIGYWLFAAVCTVIFFLQSRFYFSVCPGNPFQNCYVQTMLRMTGPLLIGNSVVYINQIVDKSLASGLASGTVTAMQYSSVLIHLVDTLIAALASVLFAHMTEYLAQGKRAEVSQLCARSTLLMTLVILPVTVITVTQARDIVAIVYGRGSFGEQEVDIAATALVGYGFYLIPKVWLDVYSRLQYSCQDSKTPTIINVLSIVINIVCSIFMCQIWGVFGITFATSLSILVNGTLNTVFARRALPELSFTPIARALPFLCAGVVASLAVSRGCSEWFGDISVLLRLCLTTLFVFLTYGVVTIPVLRQIGVVKRFLRR